MIVAAWESDPCLPKKQETSEKQDGDKKWFSGTNFSHNNSFVVIALCSSLDPSRVTAYAKKKHK